MPDWMTFHVGLTTNQFCNLLEETMRKLVGVLEKPGEFDPVKVDMARGALKLLVQGPHHVPRERKLAYVDDLIHMLVAREALFPGDVTRSLFDALVLGIPNPPRKDVLELSTRISEGAKGLTDAELIAAVEDESDRIKWRHPTRLAIYHRAIGLLAVAGAFAALFFVTRHLVGTGYFKPDHGTIIFGLACFFVLAANTLLSIVLLRSPASPFGPPLVDLASEGQGQFAYMLNGVLQHASDIYSKQPLLAAGSAIGSYLVAIWTLYYGQWFVEATLRNTKATIKGFWLWLH